MSVNATLFHREYDSMSNDELRTLIEEIDPDWKDHFHSRLDLAIDFYRDVLDSIECSRQEDSLHAESWEGGFADNH